MLLLENGQLLTNPNPYRSTETPADQIHSRPRVFYWRIPALFVLAAIASVPFLGYFVHAARDSQWVAIAIAFCWLINGVCCIVLTVLAVAVPIASRAVRCLAISLTVYLWISCLIGWGGVGRAVRELLAG